jgi:hypothetical protein
MLPRLERMPTRSSQCSTPNAQATSHEGTGKPRIKPRRNTHFSVAARWSKSCSFASTPSYQTDLCQGLTHTRNLTRFNPRLNSSAYEYKLNSGVQRPFHNVKFTVPTVGLNLRGRIGLELIFVWGCYKYHQNKLVTGFFIQFLSQLQCRICCYKWNTRTLDKSCSLQMCVNCGTP